MALSVPYTFVPQTTILSAEANTNFAVITGAVDKTGDTMTGTLNTQTLLPSVTATYDLGSSTFKYRNLTTSGTTTFNGRTLTWPSAATIAGAALTNTGADTLAWTTYVAAGPGRLTLTTAVPVTTADVTAATTLYYTPYTGSSITLYDGSTGWVSLAFTQLSIAVPATTSQMYDVFCFSSSGTPTLELTAWTNDSTRATALAYQDGIYVKAGTTTRRYLGSFRTTTVSGQTEDSLAKRYVWNYYNRVLREMRVVEATATWDYSSPTWRQARATATNQLDFVVGVIEDVVQATVVGNVTTTGGAANEFAGVGIGLDSTTVPTGRFGYGSIASVGGIVGNLTQVASYEGYPAAGRHTLVWLESGDANLVRFEGTTGLITVQSGIAGWVRG